MNIPGKISAYDRIPFYFYYFGTKKDAGIEKISAKTIAKELGFKSSTTIVDDLNKLLDNPGRKNYGYNITFLYNSFCKLMNMYMRTCNIYVIGNLAEFFNEELLNNRGFHICGMNNDFNMEEIESKEPNMVILAKSISENQFKELEALEKITVINVSASSYSSDLIPIYHFSIMEIILKAWFYFSNIAQDDE